MCWNRQPYAKEIKPSVLRLALGVAHCVWFTLLACLWENSSAAAVVVLCRSWRPFVRQVTWNGSSKCSKWGLRCDNWWETLLVFHTVTDAGGLQEPGQIFTAEEKKPTWCGWLKFATVLSGWFSGYSPLTLLLETGSLSQKEECFLKL